MFTVKFKRPLPDLGYALYATIALQTSTIVPKGHLYLDGILRRIDVFYGPHINVDSDPDWSMVGSHPGIVSLREGHVVPERTRIS